jgi:hypothetical protein
MRRTATLLVLLAAAAPAARAATFAETTVEESARNADAVVRGVVVATTSRLTQGGRRIVTDVDIAVTDVWKGAPDRTVRVVVPGGRVNGLALWVDTAPSFSPGEEVVVFLDRKGDAWGMSGAALGKYSVGGGQVHPGVGAADLVSRPLPAGERAVGAMAVDELERRVRSVR